tara:strand:+ start:12053 stop:13138 length:1086 start_codon:yes stop_codon:yes gene_type:complete
MDGHKLPWHMDRVEAWERGERIAPVMIDMALTRNCDANCSFCYSRLQSNKGSVITKKVIDAFMEDCARMGVRAVSFLSDGESVLSPVFCHAIEKAASLGIKTALGSNCRLFTAAKQTRVLKHLSYVRVNLPAGDKERYCDIMGVKPKFFDQVVANVLDMVGLRNWGKYQTEIALQMVLMPQNADQILPFVKLGRDLGVDHAVIKHCADDEGGSLGIHYEDYKALIPLLEEAESYSTDRYRVLPMWSKMLEGETRTYERCYGPPFLIQISGTGLVAPCGDKFATQYAEKFHIGNICETRWWDIWQSDRYWEVMGHLSSSDFNARASCGPLCRHHKINEALDAHVKGDRITEKDYEPKFKEFV